MKAQYPWGRWSDGKVHRIYKDHHFTNIAALRGAAHSQGLRRGGRYSIRQEVRGSDDKLLIQFIKEPTPKASTPSPILDIALLTRILKLVHPDKHPEERREEANWVTQRISALRDEMRKKNG